MKSLLNPHNHLLNLARSGQRLPHIVLAIVLSFVFLLVAQLVGGIPAVFAVVGLSMLQGAAPPSLNDPEGLRGQILPDTALEQTIFLVLAFGPIFLILWIWLVAFEKRPLWTIGMEWPGAGLKYGRGVLVGLLMFSASVGISAALGDRKSVV